MLPHQDPVRVGFLARNTVNGQRVIRWRSSKPSLTHDFCSATKMLAFLLRCTKNVAMQQKLY